MSDYTALSVVNEALKWEGYLEKASTGTDDQLKSKTWNPGTANITWFWRWLERSGCLSGLQGQAWCDAFNDYVHAVVAGVDKAEKSLNGYSAYTPDSASRYKAAGRWINPSGDPLVGDQIFYRGYVSSEGQTRIKHTGIVVKVTPSKVTAVEGNTSSAAGVVANGGCVRVKTYDRDDPAIAGYGRPLYDKSNETYTGNPLKIPEGWCCRIRPAAVSRGAKSASVLLLQEIMKARGYYKGALDWDCGPMTAAAIDTYQTTRRNAGVELGTNGKNDGVCGPRMWADLLALPQDLEGNFYLYTVSKGAKNTSVLLLQEIMKARGYYNGDLDKDFGVKTDAAVRAYQKERIAAGAKIGGADGKPDGVAGAGTWHDLLALATA